MQFMQRTSDAALTTLLPMAQLSYLLSLSPGPEGVDMPGAGRGGPDRNWWFCKTCQRTEGRIPCPAVYSLQIAHCLQVHLFSPTALETLAAICIDS